MLAQALAQFDQADIANLEKSGGHTFQLDGEAVYVERNEVEITSEDIPGWLVANEGELTVALDVTLTPALIDEGNAREFVNRIQRLRKEKDFAVTDRISVIVKSQLEMEGAFNHFKTYICTEILAEHLSLSAVLDEADTIEVNDMQLEVKITTL